MTLYARSDVDYVGLSRAHGGCGESHRRPVENGAPVKLWALDCPQCELHLKHDDQWSGTISGIPETPDEKADREDREKRGQAAAAEIQTEALKQLGEALPQIAAQNGMSLQMMQAMFSAWASNAGVAPGPIAATVPCANQHHMPATAKFCPECGAPPHVFAPQDAAPEDTPNFEALSLNDLRAYAAARNIKTTRSKADQIQFIRERVPA